jgi:hypothetical protein
MTTTEACFIYWRLTARQHAKVNLNHRDRAERCCLSHRQCKAKEPHHYSSHEFTLVADQITSCLHAIPPDSSHPH